MLPPVPRSDGKELNGRKVKVVLADRDKWSVSQSRSGNVKQEDSTSPLLMVSSLAASVGENQLRALFETAGRTVEAVTVEREKSTGESKGFGYVLFHDAVSAGAALSLHRSTLAGSVIRVTRSASWRQMQRMASGQAAKRQRKGKEAGAGAQAAGGDGAPASAEPEEAAHGWGEAGPPLSEHALKQAALGRKNIVPIFMSPRAKLKAATKLKPVAAADVFLGIGAVKKRKAPAGPGAKNPGAAKKPAAKQQQRKKKRKTAPPSAGAKAGRGDAAALPGSADEQKAAAAPNGGQAATSAGGSNNKKKKKKKSAKDAEPSTSPKPAPIVAWAASGAPKKAGAKYAITKRPAALQPGKKAPKKDRRRKKKPAADKADKKPKTKGKGPPGSPVSAFLASIVQKEKKAPE